MITVVKTTSPKMEANRRNALLSTGPRSEEGKRAVALNGTIHGLRSLQPVLPWLENARDWRKHRQAILDEFRPEGAVEAAFAERVALGFWKLGRSVALEASALAATRERNRWQAMELLMTDEGLTSGSETPEETMERLKEDEAHKSAVAELWKRVPGKNQKGAVDHNVARDLIESCCSDQEWQCLEKPFNAAWQGPAMILGELKDRLIWLASQFYPDGVGFWIRQRALEAQQLADEAHSLVSRIERTGERAAELALFESGIVEKLNRYETAIHRALLKDLHELQRLQARREGQPVLAPMVVDVSTGGDE
jgi:hypothetical protein